MKIIIVGPAYPLRGAMAQLNAILASYLSRRHWVEIISFKRQYPSLLFPGKTQVDPSEPLFHLRITPLIDSINPLTWVRAATYIRRQQPNLVIFRYWLPFFGPCFGTVAAICRWRMKTKVLCICDNIIPHERRPGDTLFTRFLFYFVDYFIVQSDTVEKDLKALVPSAQYKKVPHPIYEIFGESLKKEEARRRLGFTGDRMILFFGYVRPYKGLHLLLEAMPSVLEQLNVTLFVVGEFYEDESKYRNLIRKLEIEDKVRIVADYVPNDQVVLYFSACDVVVLPYISATQSGIVQIAYQFDKPVIATDVGGLAEVVLDSETGFIVEPNNPEELAKAITRFYEEEKESEFIAAIRVEKAKYSWNTMVEKIENLAQ